MKRQKDDTYYPEAATEAMKRMNESARKNGTSEMTLDEINAEIAACRKERRQSKRSTDILGGDMTPDMCVPCGDGLLNIRVGALIVKDGRILMVQSSHDYLYSVGGRIKMGETAEEAIAREVFEETGVKMAVKRLIAVHENYFYGDMPTNQDKLIYEISFYYEMDVPKDFEPVCDSINEAGAKEYLHWVSPDTPMTIYPEFFRKEATEPSEGVLFPLTDERTVK